MTPPPHPRLRHIFKPTKGHILFLFLFSFFRLLSQTLRLTNDESGPCYLLWSFWNEIGLTKGYCDAHFGFCWGLVFSFAGVGVRVGGHERGVQQVRGSPWVFLEEGCPFLSHSPGSKEGSCFASSFPRRRHRVGRLHLFSRKAEAGSCISWKIPQKTKLAGGCQQASDRRSSGTVPEATQASFGSLSPQSDPAGLRRTRAARCPVAAADDTARQRQKNRTALFKAALTVTTSREGAVYKAAACPP